MKKIRKTPAMGWTGAETNTYCSNLSSYTQVSSTNVMDLVDQAGVTLKKVANTKGGEYHGPCPWCGGKDRFHVWPEQNNGQGSYWCRQCEKSGDAIQFLRDYHGKSYKEACEALGSKPKENDLPPGIFQTWDGKAFKTLWKYRFKRQLTGYVVRYEKDGDKVVIPFFKRSSTKWKPGAPKQPAHLYGIDDLEKRPHAPVWVVEGEKCADAINKAGKLAVTSQGGSGAAGKTDWNPLAGREVIIWPDNDEPGKKYLNSVVSILQKLSPSPKIKVVDVEKLNLPKGGDVVDWLKDHNETGLESLPLLKAEGLVLGAGENEATTPSEWPELKPLTSPDVDIEPESYPLDALPEPLRQAVEENARFNKVDPASAAMAHMLTVAAAIGKRACVHERGGLKHYPTLFFVPVAGSSERKSPVFKTATRPFEVWVDRERIVYQDKLKEVDIHNRILDKQIKSLEKEIRQEMTEEERANIVSSIKALEDKRLDRPVEPKLYATDVTEQRLFQLMAERHGAFAVMSGEGRTIVDNILGKYNAGKAADSLYLAGFSGDAVTRDRVGSDITGGSEELEIRHPALCALIFLQPDKFEEMVSCRGLFNSGFLWRLWPVCLEKKAGTRQEKEDEFDLQEDRLRKYEKRILQVLCSPLNLDDRGHVIPHDVYLSREAAEERRRFFNSIESELRDGGTFDDEGIAALAGKCCSQTCKVALILHIFQAPYLLERERSEISGETWFRAEQIGTYHLGKAVSAYRRAGEDMAFRYARKVARWLANKKITEFSKTFFATSGPRPRPKAETRNNTLKILEEAGYIRWEKAQKKYLVNPAVQRQKNLLAS